MIYFTSDLHFSHGRKFLYGPRGYKNEWKMNADIIKNWNSTVMEEDDVYVLGDIMLNDNINGRKCWNQLRGNKFIVLGNHDTSTRVEIYTSCPRTTILGYGYPFKYEKYHFFLSHYPTLTENYDVAEPLCRQVINLCGHRHTKDKFIDMDKGLIYHVELDAHDNKPVSIDQIIEDIKERINNNGNY